MMTTFCINDLNQLEFSELRKMFEKNDESIVAQRTEFKFGN